MKPFWHITAAILTSATLLAQALPVLAAEGSVEKSYGDITYIEKEDGTLEITGLTEPNLATSANIPEKINGKTVTSIGDSAFQNVGKYLTEIIMPDTITAIGENAFANCDAMETFDLPDSLTTIGGNAFFGCGSLKSLVIPDSVTYIGEEAFYWSSLEEIQLSNSLTEITPKLFANCDNLKSVVVPNGVTSIGDRAFAYMDALVSVTLPEGVTSIGEGAFSECTALPTVVIPSTVTEIGEKAFYQADGLIEITIPDGITAIRSHTFGDCENLKTVNLPDSVSIIEDWAFSWSESLETVTVPANLKTIGENAFYPDSALTSFWLPDGVTEIGKSAFYACSSLTEFYIPNGITTLHSNVIGNCSSITKLTIGDTLEEFSSYALYGTDALTEISVSENNPNLMDLNGVVYNKNGTTLLAYPTGKTDETYVVPDGVTTIASRGLICSNLINLYLPNSLTTIETNAVYSSKLTDIWYDGTETMWKEDVTIGESNSCFESVTMHFGETPVIHPIISAQSYAAGSPIPKISLSIGDTAGTITWAETTQKTLHSGSNVLHWVFIPSDTDTYPSSVTGKISLSAYQLPARLTAPYGSKLSSIALPEGFAWETPNAVVSSKASVSYTPTDTSASYPTETGIVVTITITPATPTVHPQVAQQTYTSGDPLPEISLSKNDTPGTITWKKTNSGTLHTGSNVLQWVFTPTEPDKYASATGTITLNAAYDGILGDVTQDGKVGIQDAYQVLVYYAMHSAGDKSYSFTNDPETEKQILTLANVNEDDKIDIQDAYLILLYYAKQSVGVEVTWESLCKSKL